MDNSLQGKRILVTGAAGFVGANLAEGLVRRNAEVHALVRPGSKLWRLAEIAPRLDVHPVELTNREELRVIIDEVRPEIVFHLAVRRAHLSEEDRLETLQTNIMGTLNLLEAVAPLDYQRFVHVGGSLEYGARERPLEESFHLEPSTFYGATKAAATLLCQQFAHANQQPVVVLRLFSVYGYWEGPTRLVPTAIMAALRDQEISLTPPGYRRDLVFVEDVVEACLLCLQTEGIAGEVINVGTGQQWSNEEIIEMVQAVSGRKIKARVGEYPQRPWDTHYWVADNRKARQLLGWEPRHSLRYGLEKTIAWFRLRQDAYTDHSTRQRNQYEL
jgi:nucleoside-diphosphate-sugar epimerase